MYGASNLRNQVSGGGNGGRMSNLRSIPTSSYVGPGGNPRVGGVTDNEYYKKLTGHGAVDRVNPWLKQDQAAREKGRKDAELDARANEIENTGNQKLGAADANNLAQMKDLVAKYESGQQIDLTAYTSALTDLINQSKAQGQQTSETYNNDVLPALQEVLGQRQTNAQSAMSLEEAMDPNNKLATSIRDTYDELGQRERQRGQQDYGVLSALGAQAAQGQFGMSGPMTSGAMGQIYAQNQNQAGDAYARAQQRMYDLQQQGIERGFDDTKYWYGKGQDAISDYSGAAKDIQDASNSFSDTMGKYRGEQAGYHDNIYGGKTAFRQDMTTLNAGLADLEKANIYAGTGRETATGLGQVGRDQDRTDANYERDMEKNRANAVLFGKSLEGAGTMGGFASGLFSGMAASDRRVKTQIGDIKREHLKEFFSAVKPKKYQYKNPHTEITKPGQRYGFMLQDVAKTKLGKAITRKMPDGTMAYDKDNLQGILVAALADSYRGRSSGRKGRS